ncbi:hypothetical protein AB0M68_03540 [Streptomyces sp. NPDC051453]|uniref:hypothetical protein n=1 Tax=Streptomyces sp. NPDC051453 TaxID=3154941 RepID=UPI003447E39B
MPGPGEPLWLDEDRAWALALAHVEADVCSECGQPHSESTDEKNEFAYTAEMVRCHSCATIARTVQAHQDQGGDTRGLQVHIDKRNTKRG